MNLNLMIVKMIEINSDPSKVWDALINPEKIKQYFTGAETLTDWQIGSKIVFIHKYEGQEFINKGVILKFDTNHLLQYTYWTAFSNTEDSPENYTTITYTLAEMNDKTQLLLSQTNFKNEQWYRNLEIGWDVVLTKIKEIAEKQTT
ncbi:MAG: SRPBCC domain-containing protein [Williamsia sp.]|nr:SRPBCC domain-containing protein [Williamsia sp.]